MRIRTEFSVDHFRADCLDLPGSPPVGLGESEAMAIAHLFHRIINEASNANCESWTRFLENSNSIEVNGKTWEWPKSYQNT